MKFTMSYSANENKIAAEAMKKIGKAFMLSDSKIAEMTSNFSNNTSVPYQKKTGNRGCEIRYGFNGSDLFYEAEVNEEMFAESCDLIVELCDEFGVDAFTVFMKAAKAINKNASLVDRLKKFGEMASKRLARFKPDDSTKSYSYIIDDSLAAAGYVAGAIIVDIGWTRHIIMTNMNCSDDIADLLHGRLHKVDLDKIDKERFFKTADEADAAMRAELRKYNNKTAIQSTTNMIAK